MHISFFILKMSQLHMNFLLSCLVSSLLSLWAYAFYGSKKLNFNRRGRFNLSLSDMHSVYIFVSMLQKIAGIFFKNMEGLIFLILMLWCYRSNQAISVQEVSTTLGTWSPPTSKLYNPQENLSEPYFHLM